MDFQNRSNPDVFVQYAEINKPQLSLIPSENTLSKAARKAMGFPIANRYHLPTDYVGAAPMPSRKQLSKMLNGVHEKINHLYQTQWCDARFLSGMHMMMGLLCCFREQYPNFLSLGRKLGGHSCTQYLAASEGYCADMIPGERGHIDHDALKQKLRDSGPTLLYIDHSITLEIFDYQKILTDMKPEDTLFYDISHLNVFWIYEHTKTQDERFLFGGTFHKTFPGPQKAMIASFVPSANTKTLGDYLRYYVSSPHVNEMLALDVVLNEFPTYGQEYHAQMKRNAQALGCGLQRHYNLASVDETAFTRSHQLWVECANHEQFTDNCAEANIAVYRSFLPAFHAYGMRLGIQELTYLGLEEPDMKEVADAMILANTDRMACAQQKVSRLLQRIGATDDC